MKKLKFSDSFKRYIIRYAAKNPTLSSSELASEINLHRSESISASYLRKLMSDKGLKSYRSIPKPALTNFMMKKRKTFAKSLVGKDSEFWKRVIFSDETYIQLNINSVMGRVRRFQSSNPLDRTYLRSTVKHPLKIMIWGCFNYKGVGHIHICIGNMNSSAYINVLENKLLPTIEHLQIQNPIH